MNTELARYNMIEQQIRPWDVLDAGVLELLAVIKREDFVPPACKALAFNDMALPLAGGQSMAEPKIEARLLQELAVAKHETVLEVGAGSGYMAALLGHRAQSVLTLETRPELVAMATENLRHASLRNVRVLQADGSRGYAAEAPFDVIVLSGSVAEVPKVILDQLKIGGRLTAIVGQEPVMRALLFTRVDHHDIRTDVLFDTVAPRLDGFGEPTRFKF